MITKGTFDGGAGGQCDTCVFRKAAEAIPGMATVLRVDRLSRGFCSACARWLSRLVGGIEAGELFLFPDTVSEGTVTPSVFRNVISSERCRRCGERLEGVSEWVEEENGGRWLRIRTECPNGCKPVPDTPRLRAV